MALDVALWRSLVTLLREALVQCYREPKPYGNRLREMRKEELREKEKPKFCCQGGEEVKGYLSRGNRGKRNFTVVLIHEWKNENILFKMQVM